MFGNINWPNDSVRGSRIPSESWLIQDPMKWYSYLVVSILVLAQGGREQCSKFHRDFDLVVKLGTIERAWKQASAKKRSRIHVLIRSYVQNMRKKSSSPGLEGDRFGKPQITDPRCRLEIGVNAKLQPHFASCGVR